MFYFLLKKYYLLNPKILGFIYKFFYSHNKLRIGKNFQCDTFPKIILDKNGKIEIGDNVIFRRNVEIRCHGESEILIEDSCRIDRGVRILSANKARITLQSNVRVGLYSVFNGGDSITVKKDTLISGFVYLQTSMHNYQKQGNIQNQGYKHSPVEVGEDNWLGTHSVIFPGVTLGSNCIVGSSSVVNKSFEEDSIVGGIPAKLLKKRD